MVSTPSPPKPPDPYKTAAAQTESNVQTALTQALLNQYNQITPYGNLTFTKIGENPVEEVTYDKKGNPVGTKTRQIPQYQAETTLSPEQQQIYKTQSGLSQNYLDLAQQQLGQATSILSKPIDLSNDAVENRIMELGRKRLDPLWEQQGQQMDAKLANQGLAPGSQAYDDAMRVFSQGKNDAYNQWALQARGQALNELQAQRQIPLSETLAMFGSGQLNYPQWAQTPQTGVSGTDIGNLVNQDYQAKLAIWQQQAAQSQSMMGGLMGLGSSLLGGWMSDERVKTNISRIGTTQHGLPLYEFQYRGSPDVYEGVMAHDVLEVMPEAVNIDSETGLFRVDYDRLGIKMRHVR